MIMSIYALQTKSSELRSCNPMSFKCRRQCHPRTSAKDALSGLEYSSINGKLVGNVRWQTKHMAEELPPGSLAHLLSSTDKSSLKSMTS